jgi:hypothetical protein
MTLVAGIEYEAKTKIAEERSGSDFIVDLPRQQVL